MLTLNIFDRTSEPRDHKIESFLCFPDPLLLLIIFIHISKTRVMALLRRSVSSINHRAFFDQRMHSFGRKHDTKTYTGYRTSRDKKDRRVSSICTNVDRFLLVQPRSAGQIRFQQDHFPTANIITVATRDA